MLELINEINVEIIYVIKENLQLLYCESSFRKL